MTQNQIDQLEEILLVELTPEAKRQLLYNVRLEPRELARRIKIRYMTPPEETLDGKEAKLLECIQSRPFQEAASWLLERSIL